MKIVRPKVKGKFIEIGNEKFYIKGVTYGTFKPNEEGLQFPEENIVNKDFFQMASCGINTVRTYTTPPLYLLDAAHANGLKVMVGLPWEQHIAFLDSQKGKSSIINNVKQYVVSCQKHPAILCYTIGNEIPAPIVRHYGFKKIQKFLQQLYKTVKSVDPEGLVTYVNYPTTEYLRLPFLDFDCFNVYLETEEKLSAYIQRLHTFSIDRPLVLAEIGLDSMRNGEETQAGVLTWQLKNIFAKGCAGAFVFAWTDDWWRGGFDIEDWDFGLVTRDRFPKPALRAVSKAFSKIPFCEKIEQPFISVIVCSYNGSATMNDCLKGLQQLNYPNYEVIVVNDGSKDNLAEIVSKYPVRLITQPNNGLSNARNTGILAAKGTIIAFIDDDAYPDKDWLMYLAHSYQSTDHAGIGGPNIAPDDDGFIATCVANAPGGPVHVLLTDEIAEHIPGCNMSFKKDVLLEIGGFDPVFRAAGDDVDICWRIQHTGRTIGFSPSAFVWHHRRNSVTTYWKQQMGYGKAEALLEAKWPEKYNGLGHLSWAGRIYGNGITLPIKFKRDKVFHGIWGSAAFQSLYQQAPGFISFIPLMPEWYLLISVLFVLSLVGISWSPLLLALPILILTLTIVAIQAGLSAAKSLSIKKFNSPLQYFGYWSLTTILHVIQPQARLIGRIKHGLTPWRKRGSSFFNFRFLFSTNRSFTYWSETWKASDEWLRQIEFNLLHSRVRVRRGGSYDDWDLKVNCGVFANARGLLTIEEHGGGNQFLRFKCRSKYSITGMLMIFVFGIFAMLAFLNNSYLASGLLGFFVLLITKSLFTDKARAFNDLSIAFSSLANNKEEIIKIKEENKQDQIVDEDDKPVSVSELLAQKQPTRVITFREDARQKRILENALTN